MESKLRFSGQSKVKITIKFHRDRALEEKYLNVYQLLKKNKTRWQAIGAGVSLSGSVLSPGAGIVLNILYSFTRLGYQYPALNKISMIFYGSTIALMIAAGHFLDLLEKKDSEAVCRQADSPGSQSESENSNKKLLNTIESEKPQAAVPAQ